MSIAELRRSHNRRHELAGEVVDHLTTFEADLGRVLASGSRLIGLLPDARVQADLSAVVGQDAIGHFVCSLGLISQAMDRAVEGHRSLDQTRQHFRIQVTAGGDKDVLPALRGEGAEVETGRSADVSG